MFYLVIENQDAVIEMKNELFIMEKVKNPFAVKLYMHFLVNEVYPYICTTCADHCPLFSRHCTSLCNSPMQAVLERYLIKNNNFILLYNFY